MAELLKQLEELHSLGFLPTAEYEKRRATILSTMSDPERDRAKKVFAYFDGDKDNAISVKEFQGLVVQLGELLSDEQIQAIMKILDTNGDGSSLSFDKFYNWWKSDDEQQHDHSEIRERMKFLKIKLTSHSYFKFIKKHSKTLKDLMAGNKEENYVTGVDTYRLDFNLNFGECSNPAAGVHVRYQKSEEKVAAVRRRYDISERVFGVFTIHCSQSTTVESLALFNNLLDLIQKQFKKEGLPLQSLTGTLVDEPVKGGDGHQRVWKLVALPKPKTIPAILGVLGVIDMKQFDIDVDLTGDALLEAKAKVSVEVSKSATSLLEKIKKNVPEQLTFFLSTFGNAHTAFRFKGIGEGFSNAAFQEFLFQDILEVRDTSATNQRGKDAFSKLIGENNPRAFVDVALKELFVIEHNANLWPFYVAAHAAFEGLGTVVVVAGEHLLEVEFNFPHLKQYFASPEEVEQWRANKN